MLFPEYAPYASRYPRSGPRLTPAPTKKPESFSDRPISRNQSIQAGAAFGAGHLYSPLESAGVSWRPLRVPGRACTRGTFVQAGAPEGGAPRLDVRITAANDAPIQSPLRSPHYLLISAVSALSNPPSSSVHPQFPDAPLLSLPILLRVSAALR